MKQEDTEATSIIRFTKEQVWSAMNSVVEDVQSAYPSSEQAMHVAEALGETFERNLLRDYVIGRIEGSIDLDWLAANAVQFAIKSSVNQFVESHYLRIQILNGGQKQAWRKWREQ